MTKLHANTSPQNTVTFVVRTSQHWFSGDTDIQSKTPPPCWLLLDVDTSFMLVREYWNKGEDGLYRSSYLTDINKSTPVVHTLLPSEWLLVSLLCFTSLLCSMFFPKESTLPTQITHSFTAAEFHWLCSFCVFFFSFLIYIGFCHILHFLFLSTEFLLYFHFENLFWYYFYLKSIVEDPWKYTYLQ